MVIRFFDGFENEWRKRWNFFESSGQIDDITGRTGGSAIQFAEVSVYTTQAWTPTIEIPQGDTVFIGFALQIIDFDNAAGMRFESIDGSTIGRIDISSATDTLNFDLGEFDQNGTISLSTATWYYIEVEYLPLNTSGVFKCWVDGVLTVDLSGDTTDADQNFGVLKFSSANGGSRFKMDDVYVADSTGSINNTRLGDVVVKQVLPTGQGNYSDGVGSDGDSTDNYLLVDEDPSSTSDWVELTTGDRESYTAPVLGAGEIPVATRVSAMVFEGDASPTVGGFLRIGGTDYDSDAGDAVPVVVVEKWADWYWNENPSTSAAWAEDDLDGAEFGIERLT